MARQPAARRNSAGETTSGYFKRLFKENPQFLRSHNNEKLLNQWLTDHPGNKEIPKNVRQILSNVKSVVRSKRRRRKKGAEGDQATLVAAMSPAMRKAKGNKLEALEEQIDDAMSLAKDLDRQGLGNVINMLRRARNEVVWKMGQ
jgi:hypothetical protein